MIQNNNDNSYYLRLITQKNFKINDRSDLLPALDWRW